MLEPGSTTDPRQGALRDMSISISVSCGVLFAETFVAVLEVRLRRAARSLLLRLTFFVAALRSKGSAEGSVRALIGAWGVWGGLLSWADARVGVVGGTVGDRRVGCGGR